MHRNGGFLNALLADYGERLNTIIAMLIIHVSRTILMLGNLVHDCRLAFRTLAKNGGFTTVTIVILAVGIGAATAIFSVVEGVLVRPLPYPDADRIVRVALEAQPGLGVAEYPFSEAAVRFFANNSRSFEAFGGYGAPGGIGGVPQWRLRITLLSDGPPQTVRYRSLSVGAFEVLGAHPQLGRLPTTEDAGVALLSHGLWVDRYGGDLSIVGRSITRSVTQTTSRQLQVIGVMPPGFDFPTPEVDLWTVRDDPASRNVVLHDWLAVARLAPGVTIEEARTEAEGLIARFHELGYPLERIDGLFTGRAIVRPLKDEIVEKAKQPLLILLGASVFLLLIVCSNVANLLLVRAESRTREHAVRIALGSGRGRMIQSIIMESVLLSVAGGVGGIVLAYVGTEALVAAGPASIPRLDEIGTNPTALLCTVMISIGAGLLVGFLPAARSAASGRALRVLGAEGRGSTIGRERNRALGGLVVAQVALALLLVVGSGLMVRSFHELRSVDPGFDPEGVITFQVAPPIYRGEEGAESALFYDPLVERLAAVPGITAVGGVSYLPLTGDVYVRGVEIHEYSGAEAEAKREFVVQRTTPGYFRAMGIPILEGRDFARGDYPADYSETAFIVSASLKRRYWPNESALGKRITYVGFLPGRVVGVVGDVHHRGLEMPAEEVIYLAHQQRSMDFAVRTTGDVRLILAQIREAVAEVDPDVPISRVRMMEDILGDSINRTTFTMTLLLLAACIAVLLSVAGIYGIVSYVVDQRAPEMGLRLALGAEPRTVRKQILSEGIFLSGLGVSLGLIGSIALGNVLRSLLVRVSPFDLWALLGGSVTLLSVAALSSLAAARRTGRISPAIALRGDA